MDIAEVRRRNLRAWIDQDPHSHGNVEAWCHHYSRFADKPISPTYIRQLVPARGGAARNIGERAARKLEAAGGKPPGWLDIAPGTLLTPDLPPPDTVRPEIAAAVAAHIRPAKATTGQGTLLTLSPAEHALLDAARPLSDDDLALLEQIARRMAGEGSGPPMESREFLPPVPRLKKDKA